MVKGLTMPSAGFADEIEAYMTAEEAVGFFSRFYFLNGMGGRFGARLSTARTAEVALKVRAPHETGLHYNYDTWQDDSAFRQQARALGDALNRSFETGRAHYFRLEAQASPRIWEQNGIRFDESFGCGEFPLYRLGIAGVFPWFDLRADRMLDLLECPLIFMDSAITDRWPTDALEGFSGFVKHVAAVGGSISTLFHPGLLANREFQNDPTFYSRMLVEMRRLGARQLTTEQLLSIWHSTKCSGLHST
jgi:hypothetical protein